MPSAYSPGFSSFFPADPGHPQDPVLFHKKGDGKARKGKTVASLVPLVCRAGVLPQNAEKRRKLFCRQNLGPFFGQFHLQGIVLKESAKPPEAFSVTSAKGR